MVGGREAILRGKQGVSEPRLLTPEMAESANPLLRRLLEQNVPGFAGLPVGMLGRLAGLVK